MTTPRSCCEFVVKSFVKKRLQFAPPVLAARYSNAKCLLGCDSNARAGRVAEWFNAAVLKTADVKSIREFKSHFFRQINLFEFALKQMEISEFQH